MKILAIRGKNLASLAGEFEIDFQQQPLASAGLFAISGPTGAGKSTLLDALCLALYDQTPRLVHAGSTGVKLRDVGEETLSPQDVRNLLRRGCSEAYAEVEFIGNDHQHYRSRWSVRRAHGNAYGKLQASTMTLHRLPDEQSIGGIKTEVQQEIRQRLGLSFAQFTRAVLLAQNEFSVFLKAPDHERAELLETLTGTEEYSKISTRAFERFKLERNVLDRLQEQLADQQPMDQALRLELEQQRQSLDESINTSAQQKIIIETHLQWHKSFEALQAAENQALETLSQAQDEHKQAQERREHLVLVESLQEARPLLTELDRLSAEHQQSQVKLSQAETALRDAKAVLQTSQAAQLQAQQQLDRSEQDKQEALADIVNARALDAQINTLSPNHSQLQAQLEAAKQNLKLNETELAKKQQEHSQTETRLAEAQDWLAKHADFEELSKQWPRWDMLFKQAKVSLEQIDAEKNSLLSAEQKLSQVQSELQSAKTQADALAATLAEAEQAYQTAVNAAAEFNAEALVESNRLNQLRLEQLRLACKQWQTLSSLSADKVLKSEKLQSVSEQGRQCSELLAATREILPALVAKDEQAGKMLDLLKLACSESIEKLRASLKKDSECPVCGSKEHPFADNQHPFRDELSALEQEVFECRQRRKQAEQQEGRLVVEIEQLDKQGAELQAALESLLSELEQQLLLFKNQELAAEWAQVDETGLSAWFNQQIAESEAAQANVSLSLKAMSEANSKRDHARELLDTLNVQQKTAQKQLETAMQGLHEAKTSLQNTTEKLQGLQTRLEQQLTELDGVFADSRWQEDWRQAPDNFHRRFEQQAKDWREQHELSERLGNLLVVLKAQISGLTGNLDKAHEHMVLAQAAFDSVDQQIVSKKASRMALFAGRALSEVEAELDKNLSEAKNRLQAASNESQRCATLVAACQEALKQALSRLEDHQNQLAEAKRLLERWLASFKHPGQLDSAQLRQYLQHDNAWLNTERQVLKGLDQALEKAQTVLSERRQQSEQHLKTRASLETLENLQQQLIELQAFINDLQQQRTELELLLRNDDVRIKSAADLLAKIQVQAAVFETWNKLNSLIGSADGKKFRNIAQQLTLDILLGYANQHLKDLSRRYRLERVINTLALQVIDQEMGDEIRSVHSLSGGESFLLSLALALGLASLSSNRVRVESLFIDEGFGSLDAETLRVAMDALDSLQALGRKVGVISHVQEMTERIGARIQVSRVSGGLSKVLVYG